MLQNMRFYFTLFLSLFAATMAGTPARAESNRGLVQVIGQDPNVKYGTLIIPDPKQGSVDSAILIPGKPGDIPLASEADQNGAIDLTRGSRMGAVLTSEGRIGLSTRDGKIEVGFNGGIGIGVGLFGLPIALGSYLMLAPLEGEIGRRLYLRGSIYYAYTMGVTEVAVGYRNLTDDIDASKQYWFIEMGTLISDPASIANCATCGLAGKLMITFGWAFR